MKLFLDDVRWPEFIGVDPDGWYVVRNVKQAIETVERVLEMGEEWEEASLDHDLGACDVCMEGRTWEEWLIECAGTAMPNCEHYGTGYNFVQWMIENDKWPTKKPRVHSMNPVGRARMEMAIDEHWSPIE